MASPGPPLINKLRYPTHFTLISDINAAHYRMAPADKKYWDEVAGENLRLYRMIQAAKLSTFTFLYFYF